MEARPPEGVVQCEAAAVVVQCEAAAVVAAFNEWMRRYTENPEECEREWQSAVTHLKEVSEGKEPTYGEACAVFFAELVAGQLTLIDANKERGSDGLARSTRRRQAH